MPGPPGLDIGVAFRYVSADAQESARSLDGTSSLITTLFANGHDTVSSTNEINADYEFDNMVLDFEAGQALEVGDAMDLRLFGGIRYGTLEQSLTGTHCGDDFDDCTATTVTDEIELAVATSESDYHGAGPRIGATGAWAVGSSGVSVFGTAAASLQLNQTSTSQNFSFEQETESHIVPVIEATLGVGYERPFGHGSQVSFQAGYSFESWGNAVGQLDQQDDVGASGANVDINDASLHGLFFRARVDFGPK
jgi:hypothetical protein